MELGEVVPWEVVKLEEWIQLWRTSTFGSMLNIMEVSEENQEESIRDKGEQASGIETPKEKRVA